MAKDADQVVVGANGSVYVAPVGTALPADSDTALAAAYVELGYVNEDGVTFSDSKTKDNIPAWQSLRPLRKVVTDASTTASFGLLQWNAATLRLAFGGGAVTEPVEASGEFRYEPPAPEAVDPRTMVIEWADGDNDYRLVIPRGEVTEGVETNVTRTSASGLPITFESTPDDGQLPWFLLTNDPAFDPTP